MKTFSSAVIELYCNSTRYNHYWKTHIYTGFKPPLVLDGGMGGTFVSSGGQVHWCRMIGRLMH
jgi:hypothetical protein